MLDNKKKRKKKDILLMLKSQANCGVAKTLFKITSQPHQGYKINRNKLDGISEWE